MFCVPASFTESFDVSYLEGKAKFRLSIQSTQIDTANNMRASKLESYIRHLWSTHGRWESIFKINILTTLIKKSTFLHWHNYFHPVHSNVTLFNIMTFQNLTKRLWGGGGSITKSRKCLLCDTSFRWSRFDEKQFLIKIVKPRQNPIKNNKIYFIR